MLKTEHLETFRWFWLRFGTKKEEKCQNFQHRCAMVRQNFCHAVIWLILLISAGEKCAL